LGCGFVEGFCVTRRGGYVALGISILIACLCTGLIARRLATFRPDAQSPPAATAQKKPTEIVANPQPAPKVSTIIDLPGDPVLVRHGEVSTPKELLIAVPAKLSQDVPKLVSKAYLVNSTLVSTAGGYMGKFPEAGQEADALAVQLAVNSAQRAGVETQAQIDAGSDDDGGADTPVDAQNLILTSDNSNQLEIGAAGSQGAAQLKELILRTPIAEKISDLLIANGYSEESARMIEFAAKNSSARIETLPPQSVALTVGALDLTGDYRVKQMAIFEDGEYVITISAKDDGEYDEAAKPNIPPRLLDESRATEVSAIRFNVVDGIYSAGLRNGVPEQVVRETIQLVARLTDLRSPLQADESVRFLYEGDFRDKAKPAGKIIYVGLHGGALAVDCYAFEGSDGSFRCFDPNASAEPKGRPSIASLGNSGATSVGGILPPIKGAPVTSLFGMRFHPILHILRLHAGLDFGAPVGSQVRAAADGRVEFAGPAEGFGNHVKIQHAGFETSYSHLSEILESIKPGAEVKQGDIIALSGNTGLSTGPHLHFEFYLNGEPVDPYPHLGAEFQSVAATLANRIIAAAGAIVGSSPGGTSAEMESFKNLKAYIDSKVAELAR
jgi:murein DD-endopeptidase MepM/ murein hydrolase activator NlpD